MRRLLITDLDGTLAPLHEPLPADAVALLTELACAGVRIAVVTGCSVRGILRRVPARFGERGAGIDWYANNGGSCFRIRPDGTVEYEFDRSEEYARYRSDVHRELDDWTAANNCGPLRFAPGESAPDRRVSLDEKECQTTITLPGLPVLRQRLVVELGQRLRDRHGSTLTVRAAGLRSVDVGLATASKHDAVEHLLLKSTLRGTDVVVAGDSFGPGGADRQLLHPLLPGGLVLCAGPNAPPARRGFKIRALTGPAEVRSFLRAHYLSPEQLLDPAREVVSD